MEKRSSSIYQIFLKFVIAFLFCISPLSASDNLRFQLDNLEAEMRMLSERINTQGDVSDELLETTKKIKSDHEEIKNLKKSLSIQNERLGKLEHNIDNLQQALKSIMEVLEAGETASYKVEPGDSLDKIARKLKTSAKTLRELNHLQNDTIFPGQNLTVPSGS